MKNLLISLGLLCLLNAAVDAGQKSGIHEAWNEILSTYVQNGRVGYGDLKKNPSDMHKLNAYIDALGKADISGFDRKDRLAFWTNAYNAFTLKLILGNHPLKSIRDIKNPWKQKVWLAAGQRLSLDDVEHIKLRKDLKEPRIHFAIVCASIGCPDLYNKAFFAADIYTVFGARARSFFASPKNFFIKQSETETVLYISKIFKWFAGDFGKNKKERIEFILPFLTESSAARIKNAQKVTIKYLDYDWSLNGT